MVRLRKEKGASAASSKMSGKPEKSLEKQVLALGGTKEDLDLVKNAKDGSGGTANVDPTLSLDVSKFLKELNLGKADSASPSKSKKSKPPSAGTTSAKKLKSKAPREPTKDAKDSKSKQPAAEDKKSPKKKEKKQVPRVPEAKPEPEPVETPAIPVQLPTKVSFDPKSRFVVSPSSHWYAALAPLPASGSLPAVSATQVSSLTARAAQLHESDIKVFQTSSASNSSSSEANFLSKIIQSGTLSDRLSALTLLVQSSPLHNIKALETLKGMSERGKGKGGRDESLKALRCIVDWWVGGGAPDRKLKYFRDQPLGHPGTTDQHLLLWYFEDWLKKYFFSILQILETLSLDPLQYVRTQALTLICTLLREKPEQEQNLLRLLVNKLGDTEKSICSRASHLILQLLQTHPAMKAVIVREIIALVLRPSAPRPQASTSGPKHIRFPDDDKPKSKSKPEDKKVAGNAHARYYATITFNQIVLAPSDREVALQLIDVYFELFKELLGEGNVGEDKDVAPDADEGDKAEEEVAADKKGRVRDAKKGKGKGKGTEVRGAAGFAEVEDAHSKLISAILTGVNRALPFAKIEAGDAGINKHIDTLFLITHTSTFNISLQALVLIQQISASLSTTSSSSSAASSSSAPTSKSITDRYYRTLYASLHDSRLATSSKQAMYLNLLFKSIKADADNIDRVKAIVRRFIQVLVSGGNGATEFVAGGLYLLGELFSSIPGLRGMLSGFNEDEEQYDPRKRDPQYAHASASPLWELTPLLHHYHPAISLHARQLIAGQPLTASADLSLNTISHFLDRFVYKNPKKVKTANANVVIGKGKGSSAMQPAASGLEGGGVKLMKGEMGEREERVNEGAFLKRREEDVPVDQLFYHRFFSRKNEKEKGKSNAQDVESDEDQSEDDNEDGSGDEEMDLTGDEAKAVGQNFDDESEGEGSELDEDEIWKAMKATMPAAEGDDDLMDNSDLPSDVDDEIPSGLDADDDDEEEEDSGDDAFSLAEGSDNEDLLPLDGDFPGGLLEYDGSDGGAGKEEEEEWGGVGSGDAPKKRKRDESSSEQKKGRKKLRSLPTFASYEEYAKMIDEAPEDDI
ncbi:CCAAT-box-binding transcriptional factor [Mycena chlorophos]|uniref:CCAAT-box-binding transcriptional factor n=1 Tax=Mycena chlorophos TaxID=658473 RepID=A0A8H6WMX8_MYCCL|nr:CCAAT-box-binding transcriptional factor [Mycena chlorophos]